MDLSKMTQLKVESFFTQEQMIKQMKSEVEEFIKSNLKPEHYMVLHEAMDNGKDKELTFKTMLELINKIGNPKLGTKRDDGRVIEINHFVSIIAGLPSIANRFDSIYRFKIACEIVEKLDTVLFDVFQTKRNYAEHGWVTETSALVQFDVGENALKLEGWNRYKFPLVEKPLDWTENSTGGYHTEELRYKVTTNRGSNKQPQNVLDVINILQSNKFRLRDIDLNEEYDFAKESMLKKATTQQQIDDIEYNVDTRLLTCWQTYNAMNNLDFYFAWQFDCRGRMYNNGYDIHLQGDKFKKGCLQPVILNSMERLKLERELKEIENECK